MSKNKEIYTPITKWKPTFNLKWVMSEFAEDERNGVKFSHSIGWGWPDSIVLQQQWIADKGETIWKDVSIEISENNEETYGEKQSKN